MNAEEFAKSYADTIKSFVQAVNSCILSDDGSDDVLDRKYEEGFADGMTHAFALLTGVTFEQAVNTWELERELRDSAEERPPFECPVCNQIRPFEDGHGDCQTCVACCKCGALPFKVYCMPYGAREQINPETYYKTESEA